MMDHESGSVLVLSREGSIRVLLAGLVRDEGDEPVAFSSAAELLAHEALERARLVIIEAVAWDDDVLDLLGALEARPFHTRVALVFSAHTVSLRLHPAVGYSLFTPCPAARLRDFIRSVTAAGVDRRSRTSGVRQRDSVLPDTVELERSEIRAMPGGRQRRNGSG
jgi:DNA-binding NtrC family response regulator